MENKKQGAIIKNNYCINIHTRYISAFFLLQNQLITHRDKSFHTECLKYEKKKQLSQWNGEKIVNSLTDKDSGVKKLHINTLL